MTHPTSAPGAEPAGGHTADPAPLVEAAFARIARDNMADVPLLNPLVPVEAIGFDRWQGHWLGVLVTPWCMNLVLVPGRTEGWHTAPEGQRVFLRVGPHPLAFLPAHEPEIGAFLACSLLSPMAGHDACSARATAHAALRLLRETASQQAQANEPPEEPALPARRAWMFRPLRAPSRRPRAR